MNNEQMYFYKVRLTKIRPNKHCKKCTFYCQLTLVNALDLVLKCYRFKITRNIRLKLEFSEMCRYMYVYVYTWQMIDRVFSRVSFSPKQKVKQTQRISNDTKL